MLVDRYRYLNLFPCSDLELKLMGHPVSCITVSLVPRSRGNEVPYICSYCLHHCCHIILEGFTVLEWNM